MLKTTYNKVCYPNGITLYRASTVNDDAKQMTGMQMKIRKNVVRSILTIIYKGKTKYYECCTEPDSVETLKTVLESLKNCADYCEIYIGVTRFIYNEQFYGYKIENIIRGHCVIYEIRGFKYKTIMPDEVSKYFVRW